MHKLIRTIAYYFRHALLVSLFVNVLLLVSPLYMLQVFDRVFSSRSPETLFVLTLGAVVALMVLGWLDAVRSRLLVHGGVAADALLGERLYKEILRRAVLPGGVRHQAAVRDLQQIRQFVTGNAMLALMDAPWAPLFLALIFIMHWALGVTALIGFAALMAVAIWDERSTRPRLFEANRLAQGVARAFDQSVRNAEVTVGMGMTDTMARRWRSQADEVGELQEQASNRSSVIVAVTKFLRLVLQVAMLAVGAYLVIHDHMSSGIMLAATIIVGKALAPIELAISSWRQVIETRAAFGRLKSLLDDMPKEIDRVSLPAPQGRLEVENVLFAIRPDRVPTLRGVSFSLASGEVMALVGPSAAGKSTLARVILGLWPPRSGAVRLDGAEIAQWDRLELGLHLGYLPQDVELFAGTVGENIARMHFSPADSEAVVRAAKLAGAHEMILRLPEGYETEVGESGEFISGGQRQRIALARALFGDPRLVVLDEPNSGLDAEGEAALIEAIAAVKQSGATVILITHKPSLIAGVDKILVLRDGTVEAFGPRADVLKRIVPKGAQLSSVTS